MEIRSDDGDVRFAAESVSAMSRGWPHTTKGARSGREICQLTTVLVNAVKEQQMEIEREEREIQRLVEQVEALGDVLRTRTRRRRGRD
jgi:hypothetical protein